MVSVPHTENVSSFGGTHRANVTVSNDGTLLYSTGGSRYQLTWFRRDGSPLGTVGTTEQYIGLRLSPGGGEVMVTARDPAAGGDIWRLDLTSGARSRVTSGGRGWYAVWSPDGQRIAFSSPGGLNSQIASAQRSRRGPEPVDIRQSGVPRRLVSRWAIPDLHGKPFEYLERCLADRACRANASRTPLVQSPFTELHPQFAPDRQWLAFTSNESGRDDVYVQNLADANTRRLVSSGGGSYPRWGAEGRATVVPRPGWPIDGGAGSEGRLFGRTRRPDRNSAAGGSTLRCIRIRTTSRRTGASWR